MRGFVDTLSLLLALAGALATASGCSLRYDPDDLGSGGDDGGGEDPGEAAGPEELFVHRVYPPEVFEGQGYVADPDDEASVRAIPMVLYGQNMTADTEFTVSGVGFLPKTVDAQVSASGRWAAFELRLPVIDDDEDPRDVELVIELVKGGESHKTTVVHHLLRELRVESDGTSEEISTDSLTRDPTGVARFSAVNLRGLVQVRGAAPFRVFAYSSITLIGFLDGSGAGTTPGAGGCVGAEVAESAPCAPGAGQPGGAGIIGLAAGGGGGGGFASSGTRGGGAAMQRGAGGVANGEPSLVPMPPGGGAQPAGGGGGGQNEIAQGGGPGGGSGGVIELTTPGVLVTGSAVVQTDGAAGGACAGVGGGGGGGSGGAIMVRAGQLAEADGEGPGAITLQAIGGVGGECGTATGGDGGNGRIRVDVPDGESVTATPKAFDAPAFVTGSIPAVTAEAEILDPDQGRGRQLVRDGRLQPRGLERHRAVDHRGRRDTRFRRGGGKDGRALGRLQPTVPAGRFQCRPRLSTGGRQLRRHCLHLALIAAVGAAAFVVLPGRALADKAPRVGVVVSVQVNLNKSEVQKISQAMGRALRQRLVVDVVAGPEAMRRLPSEGVSESCVVDENCIKDAAQRLTADELLFLVAVRVGNRIQVDSTWVDPANGRSASRPKVVMVKLDEAETRFADAASLILPDAAVRPTQQASDGCPV